MDSNLRFLVARPSNRSWRPDGFRKKRERICWGTEGSNPSPSHRRAANPRSLSRRSPRGPGLLHHVRPGMVTCASYPARLEPARQPEAVAAGFKGQRDPRDSAAGLDPTSTVLRKMVAEIRKIAGGATGRTVMWC